MARHMTEDPAARRTFRLHVGAGILAGRARALVILPRGAGWWEAVLPGEIRRTGLRQCEPAGGAG